jgi:predicted DNA-binding transcriptional regulator YafY
MLDEQRINQLTNLILNYRPTKHEIAKLFRVTSRTAYEWLRELENLGSVMINDSPAILVN